MTLLLLVACAARQPAAPLPAVSVVGANEEAANTETAEVSETKEATEAEAAPLGADHPLNGRIWRAADGHFIETDVLYESLRHADYVLLGEKHDNAEHHRLQAQIITAMTPGSVAFEMLDDQVPTDADTPEGIAEQTGWADSGWPEFPLYAPVFAAALDVGAAIVGAHPTTEEVRSIMGAAREDGAEVDFGELTVPDLAEAERTELEEEIAEAHCGHAPPDLVRMMIAAQRLKDAHMADALAARSTGAVLIAGNGHTRKDRGVPAYLEGTTATVGFVEVQEGEAEAAAYQPWVEADYLWFTARVDDEDPCEAFKAALGGMKAKHSSDDETEAPAED